jgi:hypothetical protein
MNKTRELFIPLILLALLASSPLTVQAATPILEVTTDNIYLTAGEENSISINLENTGDQSIYDVEAILTPTGLGLSVLSDAQKVYNEIGKNKVKTYEPVIYVDQSAPMGAHTLSLTVVYRRFGAELPVVITVPVTLVVNRAYTPTLQYRGSEDNSITAGTTQQVAYEFHNGDSNPLQNLEISVTSQTPGITIIDGVNTKVGSIASGESVNINVEVQVLQGMSLDVYQLAATASYSSQDGGQQHQSYNLPLRVDANRPAEVTILTLESFDTSGSVKPGDVFNLEIILDCSGANAYEVMATASFDPTGSISPLGPTTVSLGDLNEGETTEVNYELLAKGDILAGQYPVSVTVSFFDSQGIPSTVTETITILVDGRIDFTLIDVSPLKASRGEVVELEADLLLVGTQSVQFVSIEAVEDNVFQRVSGSEEYIGAVDPDSPIPFDINFQVSEDAEEGQHDLTLKVSYRDHLNREKTESLTLQVELVETVIDSDASKNQGLWGWILSVLGLRR